MAMNPLTTTEQRLAQIDGGIECGMTALQVAVASGLRPEQRAVISIYARKHDRNFPVANIDRRHAGTKRRGEIGRARRAYLRGEPIDLWGNTEAQEEFLDEREGA